jgi:aspartyl-tRNA(Asn)/glutamyl-tRNA(Gln) amidotransferase subunit A
MPDAETQPVFEAPLPERARFDGKLAASGLALTAEERDAVYAVSAWMREGIAGLATALPPTEAIGDEQPGFVGAASLADLSIPDAGRRLRDGTLTSMALVEAVLARISERDPTYRGFYAVTAERARDDARRADSELAAGLDRGALHGIPVGLKDMIDLTGVATTCGSKGRANNVPVANAALVDRLVDAGAVMIGKLATYEWGTVGPAYDTLYPPAQNPWSLEHITGGSSSGCAVSVAGGLLRTSIGTDTGGSVRGPAFYCGVVGLKPTFGLVPLDGVAAMSPSMDHAGPLSATVLEAALTLDVIAGRTGEAAAARHCGQPITGLRIAYARDWFADDAQADSAIVVAMDAAASKLSELGASIETVNLPSYAAIEIAAAAVLHYECFAGHADELAARPEHYGRKTYQNLAAGVAITPEEYEAARQAGTAFRQHLDRTVFSRFDAILTVGALTPALPVSLFGKGSVWTPMRTIGFNLSGHPALAMPVGFVGGLPAGMQLIGPHHGEAVICQIGHAFEQATDHALQRPAPLPHTE